MTLPVNPVETSVLGSILLEPKAYDEAMASGLEAGDFTLDSNRRIFRAMRGIAEAAGPIDIVTLVNYLDRHKELASVGDVGYISGLLDGVPDRPSIKSYIRILLERSARRRLILACEHAAQQMRQDMHASDGIEYLTDQMLQVQTGSEDAPAYRAMEFTENTYSEWVRLSQRDSELAGLSTGVQALDVATTGIRETELWVYAGRTGDGKLMDVDEPIPTPNGFVRNGDLQDGDEVFGEDGERYKIIKAHDARLEASFKVTFDDGTFTHVHAGHLWHTFTRSDRRSLTKRQNPQSVKGLVRTTEEIASTLRVGKSGHINHSIRLARPISTQVRHLPVDPYVLGVWLGDGSTCAANFTIGKEDSKQLLSLMKGCGQPLHRLACDDIRYGSYGLQVRLKQLGIFSDKHIPHQYLWASVEQRLELLRGLMDTDGSIADDGQVEFCNTNERLARGVYHLVSSLGIKPSLIHGRAKLYGRDCGPKFRVFWTSTLDCFKLSRKRKRVPVKLRGTQWWRYIMAVEPSGPRVMRCLTTSNPSGLYLFGKNFNVTHNTNLALQTVAATCRNGNAAAVFSIEVTKEALLQRLWAGEGQVDFKHVRFPRYLSADVKQKVKTAMLEVAEWPLFVVEESGIQLSKLIAKAKLLIRREKVKLIVVDYVQLVSTHGRDEREKLTKVSHGLMALAKETGVPVIAISQLSRPRDGNENQRPAIFNLKECLAENSLVTMDDGEQRQISDVGVGERVLAWDKLNGVFRSSEVLHSWNKGSAPTLTLKTCANREITGTASHPVLTPTGWTSLGDLRRGDLIATPRKLSNRRQLGTINNDLARFLGYMSGDGFYQASRVLGFINKDPGILADVAGIVCNHFPKVTIRKRQQNGSVELLFRQLYENGRGKPGGNELRNWMAKVSTGRIEHSKRVPEIVIVGNDEVQWNYLAGLLATDGTISKHKSRLSAKIASTSLGMLRDVQIMLSGLGVTSNIDKGYLSKKAKRVCYQLRVNSASTRLLALPLRGKKAALLADLIALPRNNNDGKENLPREASEVLLRFKEMSGKTVKQIGYNANQKKRMPRRYALKLAEQFHLPELRWWAENELHWDEVKVIEKSIDQDVWDIEVEGHHNFVANGLVVHNSGSLENDAHVVVMIYRPVDDRKMKTGEDELIVGKQRSGVTSIEKVYFAPWLRFQERV